jgi:[glutamine synthetase] adenylyltransferase / [glutamine synthetase]-adenylyl-L-tyrosine phosphorylase
MVPLPPSVEEALDFSAAPAAARMVLERIESGRPGTAERLTADEQLCRAVVAIAGASRAMAERLVYDPGSIEVLAHLDVRPAVDVSDPEALRRWKEREETRVAARDLLQLDPFETILSNIAATARDVTVGAVQLAGVPDGLELSVIGMGKFGGDELNYSSDIDVLFVGTGDTTALQRSARKVMEFVRPCFRIDANLRPQGRDGPLVRSLESYDAYWERWAEPWEFQALLKAVPVAGDAALGVRFFELAQERLWGRLFSADDLRSLRHMKARVEAELARKGMTDREVKRGRGGIRDIEFSIQLLQLVHGRLDPGLRSPTTMVVLQELASAGYVDTEDADALADAYRFLRTIEHRLQLVDLAQTHAMPSDPAGRDRIARSAGYRDEAAGTALELLDQDLSRHQSTVRAIHERLYFRPMLEAFADPQLGALGRPGALEARLTAFGFADALRTHAAIRDLTKGLTRTSRLMQQMLPLLLSWLSESPDPDLGLLCLRNLAGSGHNADQLTRAFRESPEAARRLCLLLGSSRLLADALREHVDLVPRLTDPDQLRTQPLEVLIDKAQTAVGWRDDPVDRQAALRRWQQRHLVGIVARDLLGEADVDTVGPDLSRVAEAALEVALRGLRPKVPFAVIALGRFGGSELSYASDLDVVFVYDGSTASDFEEADRVARGMRRIIGGATPSSRLWELDADLRPEGRKGPLARSLEGYARYYADWALVWERQAMLRSRYAAGDREVADRFCALLESFVWEPGLSLEDEREIRRLKARMEKERIPAGEDPRYHLKLGRGSLSDVEWTVQLLQIRHGLRAQGTIATIHALVSAGLMDGEDGMVLEEAYRFCERTRNRLYLVRSEPGDALPTVPEQLRWLARSFDTNPQDLRDGYRRVTRRSRSVVERLFYGQG